MRLESHSTQQIVDLSGAEVIGTGGQATIYALSGELAAKLYHQPTERHGAKLLAMLASPPADPTAGSHVSVAWPVDVLWREGRGVAPAAAAAAAAAAGFVMPRIVGARALFEFYNPRSRRQHCPFFHYTYLHRTARNLAAAVAAVHAQGHVVGDLNESNVLARDTALVTLVDTDSFQVREATTVHRCPVGKAEYTAPELLGLRFTEVDRAPEHDRFALAVLLFQILMEGAHPFMGEYTGAGDAPPLEARVRAGHFPHAAALLGPNAAPYRPPRGALPFGVIAPSVRELFVRAFVEGHRDPAARPTAQAWQGVLREAEGALATCAANEQHRFGGHLDACPWCERARQLGGRDPFPSREAAAAAAAMVQGLPAQTPLPAAGVGGDARGALARIPTPPPAGTGGGRAPGRQRRRHWGSAAPARTPNVAPLGAGAAARHPAAATAAHVLAAVALMMTLAVLTIASAAWTVVIGAIAAVVCLVAARGRSRVAKQQVTPALQVLTVAVWLLLGTKACVVMSNPHGHDGPYGRPLPQPVYSSDTTMLPTLAAVPEVAVDADDATLAAPVASVVSAAGSFRQGCMVLRSGELLCRGYSAAASSSPGEAGPGAPRPVLSEKRFVAVAAGGRKVCAISIDGDLYCGSEDAARSWGDNDEGAMRPALWPAESRAVGGDARVVSVAVGRAHACAVVASGSARCVGNNSTGALGDGSTDDSQSGVTVVGVPRLTSVVAGFSHSCGLAEDGSAYCWGLNGSGQLGTPWTSPACTESSGPPRPRQCSATPVRVAGAMRFTKLAASGWHSCGLTTDGAVYCWGLNNYGQLGALNPADPCVGPGEQPARCSFTPVQVESDRPFTDVAVGTYHSCALARDGAVHCWGLGEDGQLGGESGTPGRCRQFDGAVASCAATPADVGTSARFASLSAGPRQSCGITRDDFLVCWGLNDQGQIGASRGRTLSIGQATAGLELARRADVQTARADGANGPAQPYFEFQVDRPAVPDRGGCRPELSETLRRAGVRGAVLVQFVVDDKGRPVPGTFKPLRSSHDWLTAAVRRSLPCMRYRPAFVGGEAVSQLVQQTFAFGGEH